MKKNTEEIYLNEIRRLFPGEVDYLKKTEIGSTADIKYIADYQGKKYFVKITTKYNLRGSTGEVVREIANNGVPIVTAEYTSYSRHLGKRFSAYPWVNGQNLSQIIEGKMDEEKYGWGEKCGKLLRQFHSMQPSPGKGLPVKDVIREYRHCRLYCHIYHITFPHKKEYDAYFKINKYILKNRKLCLCHMDYQPKNIMMVDNGLHIIDYESAMLTDPWWDLCIMFMGPPSERSFLIGMIHGYFDGRIPEEFFKITCLMTIVSLYRYAMWKMQNKGRPVIHQAEKIYKSYDGLTNPVPDFLRELTD